MSNFLAGTVANISGHQLPQYNEDFNLVTPRTALAGSADYLQWTNEMVEAQRTDLGEQVHTQMHVEGTQPAYYRLHLQLTTSYYSIQHWAYV